MRSLFMSLFISLTTAAAFGADGIPLYESLRASIVDIQGITPTRSAEDNRIGVLTTNGAGVILDASGLIATNTHVIFGARYIQIILDTGEKLNASLLYVAPDNDISILKVSPPYPLSPVRWADSNLAALDDEVITIGHSELLKNTISGGRIRSIGIRKGDPSATPEFLELNINHYQGDSGGAVFSREGEFLGLMSAKRTTENRSCLVIPSNKVHFAYINVADPGQKR